METTRKEKRRPSARPHRTCPKCSSHDVHRSSRRGFYERWIQRLVGKRPYRCWQCGYRFLGPPESPL